MAAPMKRGANVALTQEIPTLKGVVLGRPLERRLRAGTVRQPRRRNDSVRRQQPGAVR